MKFAMTLNAARNALAAGGYSPEGIKKFFARNAAYLHGVNKTHIERTAVEGAIEALSRVRAMYPSRAA